jgi:pimeloyl-ACP methyl ester carboxylesterase
MVALAQAAGRCECPVAALADRRSPGGFRLLGTPMGGMIALQYAGDDLDHLQRLINDIGPEIEAGSNRITRSAGARPSNFTRGVASARLLPGAGPGESARSTPPTHQVRGQALPAVVGPEPCHAPTLVLWGMQSDVLSEPKEYAPVTRPGSGHFHVLLLQVCHDQRDRVFEGLL